MQKKKKKEKKNPRTSLASLQRAATNLSLADEVGELLYLNDIDLHHVNQVSQLIILRSHDGVLERLQKQLQR